MGSLIGQFFLGGGKYIDSQIVKCATPCFLGHSFEDVNNWITGKMSIRHGKESTALWRIMCDADTIKKNHLCFDCNLTLGEDTTFINTYFLYESSIGYLDECLYHLAQREDGANLSSVHNAVKRLEDKTKLIHTREKIDKLASEIHGINTHTYWEGTLVFSGVEMALRMAKNKTLSWKDNLNLYKEFMGIYAVKKAFKEFKPSFGLKALPFISIKLFGVIPTFHLCRLLPERIIRRFL